MEKKNLINLVILYKNNPNDNSSIILDIYDNIAGLFCSVKSRVHKDDINDFSQDLFYATCLLLNNFEIKYIDDVLQKLSYEEINYLASIDASLKERLTLNEKCFISCLKISYNYTYLNYIKRKEKRNKISYFDNIEKLNK